MQLIDLLQLEASYLLKKSREKHTGGVLIKIGMNQGGFHQPVFMPYEEEKGELSTEGLKFTMVE